MLNQDTHQLPPFLTAAQVADLLQVKRQTVYAWIRDGRLQGARLPGGSGIRVARTAYETFVQRMCASPPEPIGHQSPSAPRMTLGNPFDAGRRQAIAQMK